MPVFKKVTALVMVLPLPVNERLYAAAGMDTAVAVIAPEALMAPVWLVSPKVTVPKAVVEPIAPVKEITPALL